MHSLQVTAFTTIALITIAIAFDFMNGFHDAANSIATIVSTGVLKPQQAILFAAFFNIIACFIFHLEIAQTIGKGIINHHIVDQYVIFSTLIGAITWNILTWRYGIPSSSSHALIGGLIGSAIANSGWNALNIYGILKIIIFIFIAPFTAFVLSSICILIISWICYKMQPNIIDFYFRRFQLISAGLYSLGHGGNDAQKTIGIIWILLIINGYASPLESTPPIWVIIVCYLSLGIGTLFGGWRIVRTMGQKITKFKSVGGCCAETASAIILFIASILGIPISTTHTITGAIIGIGVTQKLSAVRWRIAGNIILAWILTIPASAILAILVQIISYYIF